MAEGTPQGPSENFRFITARQDKVLEYQFGLGRWIMASLLLINGGALVAIVNLAERSPSVLAAGHWFVIGIVAALMGGTLSWINCNLVTLAAGQFLDWERLHVKDSPVGKRLNWWSAAVSGLAIITSVASLVCFPSAP